MKICKHYVNGFCKNTAEECKFSHIDNICKDYFFKECTNPSCKLDHKYKLKDLENKKREKKPKNTLSFTPEHSEPLLYIRFNQPIFNGNEISIVKNIEWKSNIIDILNKEINPEIYKLWHGDNHLIADDSAGWKKNSPTFNNIIQILSSYFNMTPSATRLNYYKNGLDWKPYHHDAAALKPEKAKNQNITVGVSFGIKREISFQNAKTLERMDFSLEDGTVYSFGNKVNIDFKHGIPQIKNGENLGERISIIIWGFSNNLS